VVIRREFLERVRTRWFLISTVLGPLFMAAVLVLPVVVSTTGVRERSIAVLDLTTSGFGGRLTRELNRAQPIRALRVPATAAELATVADSLATVVGHKALDGFLIVSDEALQDGRAEYRGANVSSLRDMQILSKYLDESIFAERLTLAGVDAEAVRQARLEIHLRTAKVTGAKGAAESGEGSFILAYATWFVLYIAIVVYGVSVLGSVVEEKTSRVIEVLVSSMRPFQLLAGKIIGVGGVGLLQLLIWGLCGGLLINRQRQILGLLGVTPEVGNALTFPHISFVTGLVLVTYFLLGYFLYAAMFAAVAAMSSTEAEARQAQMPVVMLLVVPSILVLGILNDPSGSLAVALGLIPFFSPIAMPVRWAAAPIPGREVFLSLGVLASTLVGVTWVASRIYRVGILMYGKRPSLREVFRWVRTP